MSIVGSFLDIKICNVGKQRVVATIEARMTSSRLPGKVLMPAAGKPLLQVLIERLKRAPSLDSIVVATTTNTTDDPVAALALSQDVLVFRGSEEDVLGRVCGALQMSNADICVEITGDCPLVDPLIVEESISEFCTSRETHFYVSNSDPHRSVPAGLDVQVFCADSLYRLEQESSDPLDREHVSFGFYRVESKGRWNPRFIVHRSCIGAEHLLVTLDYREDYELIKMAHEELSAQFPNYGASELIEWISAHPDLQRKCWAIRA